MPTPALLPPLLELAPPRMQAQALESRAAAADMTGDELGSAAQLQRTLHQKAFVKHSHQHSPRMPA